MPHYNNTFETLECQKMEKKNNLWHSLSDANLSLLGADVIFKEPNVEHILYFCRASSVKDMTSHTLIFE